MYREMGSERSQVKVAATLHKSETLLSRWATVHRWAIRAEAWDRDLDSARSEAARAAVQSAASSMGTRHATAAQMTLEAVLAPIRVAVKRLRDDPRFSQDLSIMDPADLMNLVSKMAKFVGPLIVAERLARGEATEIVQGEIMVSVRPTNEQLAKVLDALVEAKALPAPEVTDVMEVLEDPDVMEEVG